MTRLICICSMQWPGLNYTCTTGKNRHDVTIKALTYWPVTLLLGRGSHSLIYVPLYIPHVENNLNGS